MPIAWMVASLVVLACTGGLAWLTFGLMKVVIQLEYRTRSLSSRCEAVRDAPELAAAQQTLRRF
jgi:hypothetical protein